MDSNFSTDTTDTQPTQKKAGKSKPNAKKTTKRLPLSRPNLRVDMVALCAVVSAACLPIVLLTQFGLLSVVNGRSISYMTLPDGSTTLAQLKPSNLRTKETVESFVLSIATNITTWQVRGANTTVAIGDKKMPMLPFLSFYAFDESIRLPLIKDLANQIPPSVTSGQVETAFKVKHLRANKLTGTENWKVSVIGYIVPHAPGSGDGNASIFKKNFYITPLDDIPILPAAKIKDVDESFRRAVGVVMAARLNITKFEEMPDSELTAIMGAAPSPAVRPSPQVSAPPASTPPRASPASPQAFPSRSPQPTNPATASKSSPPPGAPGNSAKPFTKK
jgi:hypothetical protein